MNKVIKRKAEGMQFAAQIIATGKSGHGDWAHQALVNALDGSEDACSALKIVESDSLFDDPYKELASVPEYALSIYPWATWAAQCECCNDLGMTVALVCYVG